MKVSDKQKTAVFDYICEQDFAAYSIITSTITVDKKPVEILNIVTFASGDLLGRKINDVTSKLIKKIDEQKTKYLIDKTIDHYTANKTYEYKDNNTTHKLDVLLLVRAEFDNDDNFLFLVSQVIEDTIPSNFISKLWAFIKRYIRPVLIAGAFLGSLAYELYKRIL